MSITLPEMREQIVAGKIYHVLNRGVDKRNIFISEDDYARFVHNLFEFNDTKWVFNAKRRFVKVMDIRCPSLLQIKAPRTLLVEILTFCLMPNHYHLLLKPRNDGAISKFMQKINMGYSKYFNERYERDGALFQGKYKLISVKTDSHFIHLPYYIHLNPLDLKFPEWRGNGLKDYKRAFTFLENYRWSSFLDYIGKKNFPSVTARKFLLDFFGSENEYKNQTIKWLKEISAEKIKDFDTFEYK
jgi:putative transposase